MNHRKEKIIGIFMAIIGIVMIVYTGFNYINNEKVDIRPMHMRIVKDHPIQWSPIVGLVLLVGGIVLIVTDKKKIVNKNV